MTWTTVKATEFPWARSKLPQAVDAVLRGAPAQAWDAAGAGLGAALDHMRFVRSSHTQGPGSTMLGTWYLFMLPQGRFSFNAGALPSSWAVPSFSLTSCELTAWLLGRGELSFIVSTKWHISWVCLSSVALEQPSWKVKPRPIPAGNWAVWWALLPSHPFALSQALSPAVCTHGNASSRALHSD